MATKTKYYVTALHGGLQIRDRESGADVPCDLGRLDALGVAAKYDAALEIARLLNEAVEPIAELKAMLEASQQNEIRLAREIERNRKMAKGDLTLELNRDLDAIKKEHAELARALENESAPEGWKA